MISIQNVISCLSLIVSSGAVGYAIRLVIRIEVLETLFNEKKEAMDKLADKQTASESDILRLKDTVIRIENSIEKVAKQCESLPSINERLGTILENMVKFVPKSQLDEQFNRVTDRIVDNKNRIGKLEDKNERSNK